LSERESEVLRLIAAGLTNQQVCDALYISLNTVKTHSRHIFRKLGVSSRTQAIRYAHENGISL
jgi:LuxR family transcriptional regulator, maltose regulon positive regulatory protein